MKQKTYRADSINEAMLKVKLDMGEDARIVETREVQEGGFFGFLSQTVVEVDACQPRPGPSRSGSRGRSRSTGSPTSRNRAPSETRGSPADGNSTPTQNQGFEREIDEPAVPDFSPRRQAERLIDQKQQESTGAPTEIYERPRPGGKESDRSDEPISTPGTPPSENGTSDQQASEKKITRLIENTDLLTEKVDELASSLEEETRNSDQRTENFPGQLSDFYEDLTDSGMEQEFARDLIGRVRRKLEPDELDDRDVLVSKTRRVIRDEIDPPTPLDVREEETLVLPFIGPTGVGKTTTMAKLAAYFSVEESHSVGFVTFDTYRLAAVEQLKCYADILQVPIEDVMSRDEFQKTIQEMRQEVDIVFVDTAGRSQYDEEKLDELKHMLGESFPMRTHLVVDCTYRTSDLEAVLEGFGRIGYDRLVVTKLDETCNHGSIYNIIRRTDQPIAYFTDGQDVPDDLRMMDPEDVAKLVTNTEATIPLDS